MRFDPDGKGCIVPQVGEIVSFFELALAAPQQIGQGPAQPGVSLRYNRSCGSMPESLMSSSVLRDFEQRGLW